jgi:hypothetical protein
MSILGTAEKQPADVQDYDIDFGPYILASNESLSDAHTAVVTIPADISQPMAHSITDGIVKVWIGGGIDGQKYEITVTLTTPAGRVHQEEFILKVKET